MIVAALPENPSDGDTVFLRLGSSPYDYVLMIFVAEEGRWVSPQYPCPGNYDEIAENTSTQITIDILSSVLGIGDYRNFFDTGLRPQTRLVGTYSNSQTGGAPRVFSQLFVPMDGASANAIAKGITPGVTGPDGTTDPLIFDSGWQDFDDADPGEFEPQSRGVILLRSRLVNVNPGTASVTDRQFWFRWASAGVQVRRRRVNVFVAG